MDDLAEDFDINEPETESGAPEGGTGVGCDNDEEDGAFEVDDSGGAAHFGD